MNPSQKKGPYIVDTFWRVELRPKPCMNVSNYAPHLLNEANSLPNYYVLSMRVLHNWKKIKILPKMNLDFTVHLD